jgi:hypothetical protein
VSRLYKKCESLDVSEDHGPPRPVTGIAFSGGGGVAIKFWTPVREAVGSNLHICTHFHANLILQIKILIIEVALSFRYKDKNESCKRSYGDVFWDMTPHDLVGTYQRFGGICCLHLQKRLVSQALNK